MEKQMDIKVFQTGRHYSDKGQRIAYTCDDKHIYFVDADRGIDGVFMNAFNEKSVSSSYLMHLYDRGGYGYYERDELHIRDALSEVAYNF
jgi:hypothetical protein